MNWYIPLAFALGLALGLSIALIVWRIMTNDKVQEVEAAHTQRRDLSAPKRDSNPLLIPPPMVGDQTVMKWAIHYHIERGTPGAIDDPEYGIWARMIRDMYTEASQDIGVARHFSFTDMTGLQKKFTATLCLVLDKGVRQSVIPAMEKVHSKYNITEREYDAVALILVNILGRYHVPQNAIDTVVEIAGALKPVITAPIKVL